MTRKPRSDKGTIRVPVGRYRVHVYGEQTPDDQLDLQRLAHALLEAAREQTRREDKS